jgi:general secretion pathway protein A
MAKSSRILSHGILKDAEESPHVSEIATVPDPYLATISAGTDLLTFYGMREHPFATTPNPRFLYESPTHAKALNRLVAGIKGGEGFQALIASPGMGKTTLVARILEQFQNSAAILFLYHTQCDSREFMKYLFKDLGISDSPTDEVVEIHQQFRKFLVSQRRIGKRVLLVVDEAQNLEAPVLETIRLLSNVERFDDKLVQILLVGQIQLWRRLLAPELLQLRQRISFVSRLRALSGDEGREYIHHRLKIAGHTGYDLFTDAAIDLIHKHSGGIPRNINTMCSNCLIRGAELQKNTIDAQLASEVAEELEMAIPSSNESFGFLPPIRSLSLDLNLFDLTLQSIAQQIQRSTGATGTAIALGQNNRMVCRAQTGSSGPAIGTSVQWGFSEESLRARKPFICNDTQADPRAGVALWAKLKVGSVGFLPLFRGEQVVGMVGIFSDRQNAFNAPEITALCATVNACMRTILRDGEWHE